MTPARREPTAWFDAGIEAMATCHLRLQIPREVNPSFEASPNPIYTPQRMECVFCSQD